MNKLLSAFAALLLVLLLTAGALAEDFVGQLLPDFSVETTDGGTFTLSDALQEKEIVLVNLFATWCPPCRAEFPYLEEASGKYEDRVDVIALTVEPSDSLSVLADFAQGLGLTFPMGCDTDDLAALLRVMYIPTTVIVNRDREILAYEVGAKPSAEAFCTWFDSLLPASEK